MVLDYNGTLAVDGELVPGVVEDLAELSAALQIHVITADTFGMAAKHLAAVSCHLSILDSGRQEVEKQRYVRSLGGLQTAAMGNGRNDRLMLQEAVLGVAVILEEGAAVEAFCAADVACVGIRNALQLLMKPLRLTATLRS